MLAAESKPDAVGSSPSRHPETEVCANTTVILDAENTVQPDALLRRLSEHGGLSRVFPGLRLPVAPLLAGDTAKILEALTGHEPLNR